MSKRLSTQRIAPCLWFDDQAETAAEFYTGIFPNSRILRTSRYDDAGKDIHGKPVGSVMTVAFELDGHAFTALNGGRTFAFSEAISFQVNCETQEEVDYYWDRLSAGGDESAQQCGWLKDRFGVSWQIIPIILIEMIGDADAEKSRRVIEAVLRMKKIEVGKLEQAFAGRRGRYP